MLETVGQSILYIHVPIISRIIIRTIVWNIRDGEAGTSPKEMDIGVKLM